MIKLAEVLSNSRDSIPFQESVLFVFRQLKNGVLLLITMLLRQLVRLIDNFRAALFDFEL